jgi:hypothetical protein
VIVLDNVLPEPESYRAEALARGFTSVPLGPKVFHGIQIDQVGALPAWIAQRYPRLEPHVSFLRQSPAGQAEPNYVHSDTDMGDWTGILYLNPDPAAGDGTVFYRHLGSGALESACGVDVLEAEWSDPSKWARVCQVFARFNRLLLFPSRRFHSRAILENYGAGDESRLIHVVFGRGLL